MIACTRKGSRIDKAVVIGASGFIGINLVRLLSGAGVDVTCFSRTASPHWPSRCHVVLGDLSAPPPALLGAMSGAVVYHLASTTRPSKVTTGAVREIEDNIASTVSLLEAAGDRVRRWVFTSSGGTVYGRTAPLPIRETHPTQPISSYGIVKLAIEHYLHLYKELHGIDYVVARVANPYGPFQPSETGQGLIAMLFARIVSNRSVEIWGNGKNVRDFIHVTDVTRALYLLGCGESSRGETYNIGSGRGASVVEIIEMISELLGATSPVVFMPPRGVDVEYNVLDIGKALGELEWEPEITLPDGLRMTAQWLGLKL